MRPQSVSAAVAARAWQAASSAWRTYGPGWASWVLCLRAAAFALARAARPWVMSSRFQRPRSCSSRVTGAPPGPVRAGMRDAWISISATSPCASGSSGASAESIRPRRIASSHSSARYQDSPDVAA